MILNLVWESAPKWFSSVVYLSTGWVAIVTLPPALGGDRPDRRRPARARRSALPRRRGDLRPPPPDPRPEVFGYHEIFHVLVIAAAAVQYAAVAIYALPAS